MAELVLKFFGLFSVAGGMKNKAIASPLFIAALVGIDILLNFIFSRNHYTFRKENLK